MIIVPVEIWLDLADRPFYSSVDYRPDGDERSLVIFKFCAEFRELEELLMRTNEESSVGDLFEKRDLMDEIIQSSIGWETCISMICTTEQLDRDLATVLSHGINMLEQEAATVDPNMEEYVKKKDGTGRSRICLLGK